MKPSQPRRRIQPPSSDRGALALTMDAHTDSGGALYRAGSAEPLKPAERKELLEAVRGGEAVELEMEVVPFIQRDTPNRNFVRFPTGKLPGFAKSYEGQPFLRDHASYDLLARGGTILASKLEHNDDGSKQMRMRVRLVKPWAVEGALDGTLDRFSIGWDRNGAAMECSIHSADWYSCSCRLGAKLEDGRTVEVVVPNPTGTEMSGVNVPAVVGTSIESISQLGIDSSRLADTLGSDTTPGEHDDMDAIKLALISILGLSVTAEPDEILAAAEKQRDSLDDATEQLDELKTSQREANALAITKTISDRKIATKAKLDALKAAGKLKPGSGREDRLRARANRTIDALTADADARTLARAAADFDDFIESCDELMADGEVVTPAGAPPIANKPDAAGLASRPSGVKAFVAANPVAASWLAKAGITEEQAEKHAKLGVEYVEAMQNAR